MRKLLLAILFALYIPTIAPAATDTSPPTTYQEFAQAHEQWNRKAVIILPTGKRVNLGDHVDNPFPNRDACVEGLEADTETIFKWLMSEHVDISEVDVDVTCEPDEGKPL